MKKVFTIENALAFLFALEIVSLIFFSRIGLMQIKFGKIKFTAAKSEKGCRFDACYKGEHVAFESEDMSLYDDVFSDNNRRAKAAKRVVYENIKHKYYETHRD